MPKRVRKMKGKGGPREKVRGSHIWSAVLPKEKNFVRLAVGEPQLGESGGKGVKEHRKLSPPP